ncbi:MAG TPA: response regulator transcription factor [Candidatus Udaeobacter sp.]|nr:response regulator transcription factor [Candidatus Udaeobacter sp.]
MSALQATLLLIEDNRELSGLLVQTLTASGYVVDTATTASQAAEALGKRRYSAAVLDLGLPDRDGLSLLRDMRKQSDPTPVLVLTARGGVQDRIKGLRGGADDYLAKPFETEELIARLEALLRRQGNLVERVVRCGRVAFDSESRQVTFGGRSMVLPPRESTLLEILMRHIGRVVPKRQVEDQLFGVVQPVGSNAVEVYVHRLRKLLADAGAGLEIHTVRGVGYLLGETK